MVESSYLHYCPLCDLWPWNMVLPCQPVQLTLICKNRGSELTGQKTLGEVGTLPAMGPSKL